MADFAKAKRESLKKWRGIQRDLPKMRNKREFSRTAHLPCGFCEAYGCIDCPAYRSPCHSVEWRNVLTYKLWRRRYWRKHADAGCRWVIREVRKLEAPNG